MSRGRGDAPITWGDESDDADTKFKETVLPPGFLDEIPGETVGTSLKAPHEDPATNAPRNASRSTKAATGRATWNRNLRPRHKAVVRDYFQN